MKSQNEKRRGDGGEEGHRLRTDLRPEEGQLYTDGGQAHVEDQPNRPREGEEPEA